MHKLYVSVYIILILGLINQVSCRGLSIESKTQQTLPRQEVKLQENYTLGWEVDLEDEVVTFDLTVKTTGFVGFGLNSISSMAGADIVIGGVDSDGISYFEDRHGTINGDLPAIDESKDWTLLEASEVEGITFLKFSRILDTCDPQDFKINEDTINVIWSIGATDELTGHGGNRGGLQLNLLDGPMPSFDPTNYKSWEVRINDTMPSIDTSYMCTIHKTPSLPSKHHLVAFETILSNDDAVKHTHHFTAFRCTTPNGEAPDDFFGKYIGQPAGDCEAVNTEHYDLKRLCTELIYVWAVGGKPLIFPDNVGFALSEEIEHEYILLEFHYDNPDEREGITFEAGFNAYYTDELRIFDAEIMMVALDVLHSQVIPPDTARFTSPGHCHSSCTQDRIQEEGINIFAYMFHSHLAGREMKWRVWREGKEMAWPAYDFNYDFNFQQSRSFREPFVMLPGDQAVVECTYSTTGRNVITKGGYSSREEMCQVITWYYPKGDFRYCSSHTPPTDEFYALFGIEKVDREDPYFKTDPIVLQPLKYQGMTFSHVLNTYVEWTPQLRETLRKMQYDDPQINTCEKSNATHVSYPDIIDYIQPNECQVDNGTTTTGDPTHTTTNIGSEFVTAPATRLLVILIVVLVLSNILK